MSKPKYKIVNMVEHELNAAYAEGYEFLCPFTNYYETSNSHTNQQSLNGGYNNQPITIQIHTPQHNHQAHQDNKVLMQLTKAGEILYANPRTNQD